MCRLKGRRILLGISAGIAAYKAAELARLLLREGAEVRVVMTPSAKEFIAPMTLQALTGQPVRDALFDAGHEAAMGHIELARWADLVVVAPATADFLARLAAGFADTLLHTLCLACDAPVAVAPAMNQQMWASPATQTNITRLEARGVLLCGPAEGEQACGDVGPGRMQEPVDILQAAVGIFSGGRLADTRVLLTAGPTREAVDPVRYLGNRSSGKMGFALADALVREGAGVVMVAGPVSLKTPAGVERIDVESALQMHNAVMQTVQSADIFVACAAVADYRPVNAADMKIKKQQQTLTIELQRNPDILADVSARPDRPFCVGFAAETNDLENYAEGKRKAKKLDMIAANQVGGGQGFENDNNALLVLWEGGRQVLPQQSKVRLAEQLVSLIAGRWNAQTTIKNS